MDALSDVLRAIRISGGLFFRAELRAPFSVQAMKEEDIHRAFGRGADHVLPFHMVTSGRMWIDVPGEESVQLETEDVIVLPRGSTHALADRPGRTPVPVGRLQDRLVGSPPTLRHGGDGPEASALCGFFRCNGKLFNPLLDAMPPVLVIRRDPRRTPWLAASLQRAYAQACEQRPGTEALIERLIETLFVDVVHAWTREHDAPGWLAGLHDPVVARALACLHADPALPWTVDGLARRAGASRSLLAERFRATLRLSPIEYLTRWRMELAAQRLLESDRSVAEIAPEVGYQSEAALNRAFKRHAGQPPAAWRRARLRSRLLPGKA